MQIILHEEDLRVAMANHLSTLGMDMSDKDLDISFTAGRGSNGYSACVDLSKKSDVVGATPKIVPSKPAPFKTEPDTDVDGTEAEEIDDADNVFASNG